MQSHRSDKCDLIISRNKPFKSLTRHGTCSASAIWTLSLEEDDGNIEVDQMKTRHLDQELERNGNDYGFLEGAPLAGHLILLLLMSEMKRQTELEKIHPLSHLRSRAATTSVMLIGIA